jgi:catechol-2,3-dioxygenase
VPITRLNHAVLYVRSAAASAAFYCGVLGFRRIERMSGPRAAFLQAPGSTNDHDLGLFEVGPAAPPPSGMGGVGLYHLAWEVDTLSELARLKDALAQRGALVGAADHGTTKSLYGRDPDGIEFEVVWIVPRAALDAETARAAASTGRLDLEREMARYGADAEGGVGISHPARP